MCRIWDPCYVFILEKTLLQALKTWWHEQIVVISCCLCPIFPQKCTMTTGCCRIIALGKKEIWSLCNGCQHRRDINDWCGNSAKIYESYSIIQPDIVASDQTHQCILDVRKNISMVNIKTWRLGRNSVTWHIWFHKMQEKLWKWPFTTVVKTKSTQYVILRSELWYQC